MPRLGHVRKPFERKEAGIVRVLIADDDQAVQGFDSRALALKVCKDYPETVIPMMTSFAAELQCAHNLYELIHEVVAKPFSRKQICDVAEEALPFRGRKLH